MPEVVALRAAEAEKREREEERRQRQEALREERAKERAARDALEAAELRRAWHSEADGRTTRERVLCALASFGDEGASAYRVAEHLGIERGMLSDVHGVLLTATRKGEATRERVHTTVFHAYSRGMSSVYRFVPPDLRVKAAPVLRYRPDA